MCWKLFWTTLIVYGIEIMVNIGMQSSSDLGGGGCCGDPLAWKIYVMPECMRVEIGMQTHIQTVWKTKMFTIPKSNDSKNTSIQILHTQSINHTIIHQQSQSK